jgi:oxygen-independent coproporphyrinogen III oxidase
MIDRSALLSARVPRYTSYPTAPHFSAGVDGGTYGRWLTAVPQGAEISIYLHVPFCDSLCWFCGCHTAVVNHYDPVRAYLETVYREIEMTAAAIGPGRRMSHLHFGGGSPTILSADDIARLGYRLQRHFPFAQGAEFAVEIDPRDLSDATVAALARAGVTRASIGVQDESLVVQRAINRVQPHEVTKSAVDRLRAAGIGDLNIDLIYGLPHQGEAELARTVEKTLELKPQRFAVFGYAHLPTFKKHMALIDASVLPDAQARLRQYDLAHRLLCDAGYVPVGLDHFALPDDGLARALAAGTLRRNFQGYTDDAAAVLIGVGASAIGRLAQGYVQNCAPVPEYRKAIAAGRFALARGVEISDDDRLRGCIIERLMCQLRVDLDAAGAPFGHGGADFADEIARLAPLEKLGFVRIEGPVLTVPLVHRFGVRLVASAFDAYLDRGDAVHSVAV